MNQILDKVKDAEYIYSIHTKWGLKKYSCNVAYFTEEPLDDLYYVICSILATNNGRYNKVSLGILLGFCMSDYEADDHQYIYYDVAEVRIFEDILDKVEKEHLIIFDDSKQELILTKLGEISLKERKHYQFYSGTQYLYEHASLKSELPTAMLMFPFYNDMGIYTTMQTKRQIWPDDSEVESSIYNKADQLIKRLELQSKDTANIYHAQIEEYFELDSLSVSIKLLKSTTDYIPVVMKGSQIAVKATELVNNRLNELRRENLILECLFQKLWDDKALVLNYATLNPFFDLVDIEELTKDSRTVWSDDLLLNEIVKRANQTCWRNLTRYCDVTILCNNIDRFRDNIDWAIFTQRVNDDFLIENFKDYPWDLEILSNDPNREDSVIERLILIQKESEEDWDWDELEHRLSDSFVLSHLDIVKVNLTRFTNDSEDVRAAILSNIDKRWDWNKIEREFDLNYIYSNILKISPYLSFIALFDRIFVDRDNATLFSQNKSFHLVIETASRDEGPLSSAIFNDKNYVWLPSVIDLFLRNGLLSWPSTPYMVGFEQNPYIEWNLSFFESYYTCVTTDDGQKYVSKKITDIEILTKYPNFNWNWDSISCNPYLVSDRRIFLAFGNRVNWTSIFRNHTNLELLQSLENIDKLIGDDKSAWSAFSSIASIDYVVAKYKESRFPWDWSVLTERMFSKLKLDNLGNELFVNKWDWDYLSKHVNTEFLNENLAEFSTYWKWAEVFPRILTKENRLDESFLDEIAVILTNISDTEKLTTAWHALTIQYTFKELKNLIKDTVRKRNYWWDISYFCQHPEFDVFRDLDDCRNLIDWDNLSSSSSVDKSFTYNPKLKIKQKAWIDDIKSILSNVKNRWNFKLLSQFVSLRDELWFLLSFKDKLDWDYLSRYSKVFALDDKQKLNEVIEALKSYINFKILSDRQDINIVQIIKIYPHGDYDYNELINKKVYNVTLKIVESRPDYEWDWHIVTSQSSFVPSVKFILNHISDNLNWEALSRQDNQQLWSDERLISKLAKVNSISQLIDWRYISSLCYFPLSKDVLQSLPLKKLNWESLSRRKALMPFLDDYADYIDWQVVSQSKHLDVYDLEILKRYKDRLHWSLICERHDFQFSNEILEIFPEYIDWDLASRSIDINFSIALMERFNDKWNWYALVKNKAFHNKIDISELPFARQLNIVDFIQRFPHHPKAYHFTHMSNAIKIIRTMKLQSRDYADGNFANSAGSNVHRTNKAHRFARFYFIPKSPTQFYNECLGKDHGDRYYDRAYGLGLPKCPMPVFFIFDIEELLMVIPEKCHYSNGNMQKDSSCHFKVIEDPTRIKAREIYYSRDNFNERQQEFLIEGELDFSKLKNVQICCYDSFQAELLRKELTGSLWKNVISVDSTLYEHTNKELFFDDTLDSIRISTDYRNPFEFRVSYLHDVPTIISKDNVVRQRGNDIYLSSTVEIKKDVPFEIFFEVKSPRIGSWLIYKNN